MSGCEYNIFDGCSITLILVSFLFLKLTLLMGCVHETKRKKEINN